MSHAIKKFDKGAVGFTTQLGKTWHGIESYTHFDGPINIEIAERIANYEVKKMPLFFKAEEGLSLNPYQQVDKAYCLYRDDIKQVIYPTVGERYEVISNMEMLNYVQGIFKGYDNIKIESIGTLNNGQQLFVNLNVVDHVVKGDISPTKTRLMFTNSFGAESLTACLHQTRVVCMNTVRMAQGQGEANKTIKKFRHTKNASQKVEAHVLDLASIVGTVKEHNEKLDQLAEMEVNTEYVENFLENLFPTKLKAQGRGLTLNLNKQDAILDLFESKSDLTALKPTRYRLFNAVTDYTTNEMSLKGDIDNAKRFMNVASQGGSGDKLNQQAFNLLTV
jgi:phage/plasmid-like protein (TIGR03299 family)